MIEFFATLPALFLLGAIIAAILHVWNTRPGLEGTVPGPMGLPFVGYAPLLGKYPWMGLHKMRNKYPHVVALYMGKDYTVVLQDYEAFKAFIIDQEEVFLGRPEEHLLRYLTTGRDGEVHGVLFLEGPKWQHTHNFCREIFEELGVGTPRMDQIILRETQHVIMAFRQQKGAFDPDHLIYAGNKNILNAIMFSRPMQYNGPEFKNLTSTDETMVATVAGGLINHYPWLKYVPGPLKKGWDATKHTVESAWNLFEKEYYERERKYAGGEKIEDFFDAYFRHTQGGEDRNQLAMQNKDDLITTSIALWSAGPESCTVSILWAIYFMCAHQDIQRSVREEIDRVIGKGQTINTADREKLPFTSATLYECLRLGCNAPLGNPRSNFDETTVMGYKIPKRTQILPNFWAIHRDPQYFKDPLFFNPERFIGSSGQVEVPPQFIQFGVGRRDCPGKEVAKSMLFIMFANIMQQMEVQVSAGHTLPPINEYRMGISCKPLPYKIRVIPRN